MMARIEPFEEHPKKYERWFENNKYVYRSEVNAIKSIMPDFKKGVEIGAGSGRFALPLDIEYGVEPSRAMREIAERRGIKVIEGIAENLPYEDSSFEVALMVTTLCFLDDVEKAFCEVCRILEPGGFFINGFVDKNSKTGKIYQKNKKESVFYRVASFYSVEEVIGILEKTGFKNFKFRQTIFDLPDKITEEQEAREGYGEGSFVVIRAQK
jgi:ubiquinone/menaquinone biosynthesis C-methylase UbiE